MSPEPSRPIGADPMAKVSKAARDIFRKVIVSFDVRPVRRATVEMVGRAAQAEDWVVAQWIVDDATKRGCFSPVALSDLPLSSPVASMLARWADVVEQCDAEAVAAISQALLDGVGPRLGRGPSD